MLPLFLSSFHAIPIATPIAIPINIPMSKVIMNIMGSYFTFIFFGFLRSRFCA